MVDPEIEDDMPEFLRQEIELEVQHHLESLEKIFSPFLLKSGFAGDSLNFKREINGLCQYISIDVIANAHVLCRINLGVSRNSTLESAWQTRNYHLLSKPGKNEHFFIIRENKYAVSIYEQNDHYSRFTQDDLAQKYDEIARFIKSFYTEHSDQVFDFLTSRISSQEE